MQESLVLGYVASDASHVSVYCTNDTVAHISQPSNVLMKQIPVAVAARVLCELNVENNYGIHQAVYKLGDVQVFLYLFAKVLAGHLFQ